MIMGLVQKPASMSLVQKLASMSLVRYYLTSLAAITVAIYIANSSPSGQLPFNALRDGAIAILVVWVLLAIPVTSAVTAENANLRSYGLIKNHLSRLQAQFGLSSPTINETELDNLIKDIKGTTPDAISIIV
jgi:hypothetical protein